MNFLPLMPHNIYDIKLVDCLGKMMIYLIENNLIKDAIP
jgi:hypothetical protein